MCVVHILLGIHRARSKQSQYHQGRFTIMDHEGGPCMDDGLLPWSDLMVQLPWFGFLKCLVPQLGVKSNVDQEE